MLVNAHPRVELTDDGVCSNNELARVEEAFIRILGVVCIAPVTRHRVISTVTDLWSVSAASPLFQTSLRRVSVLPYQKSAGPGVDPSILQVQRPPPFRFIRSWLQEDVPLD